MRPASLITAAALALSSLTAMAQSALEKGQQFLQENAKKEGVKTTPSGLQYEVLKEGTGKSPKATDVVEVNYAGKLLNGTEFDSSYKRGESISFGLNQVIPGWTEGVQLMKEGAKYRFYIPSNLAYGSRGAGGVIGPDETLIFDVELIKVK
ncbi:MAG TPA: FKBP-type peptidyl-prolyl cis-trans isomerase [Terrimicrobiaceae bacterium]|nr:FKBP-type peptidyl-prolyl cis-trans isomerase [Terrimicrobiaceae bacterium]